MDIGYFLFPSMLLDLTEDTVYKPCLVFFFFLLKTVFPSYFTLQPFSELNCTTHKLQAC